MSQCELLAPAGSFEALQYAVYSGTDAVYLGGSLFNARASAVNFDNELLEKAVDFCHLRKVKVYVTVNILISDREFNEFDKFIRFLDRIGVDGVIVQDIGAAMYIKKIAPSLALHASTQMTVYDLEGALFLKKLGFKRVVLARELSYESIKNITEKSGIETEIFVHGAMCVCYSGQCLMSSMIGGRSGNRGKCAQPCRLMYTAENKKGYLLSLKDMCLIEHLKKIKECGVSSLKIEGRMKGEQYVGTVVSIYRKYIDSNAKIDKVDYEQLERIFYRGGFTDGYFVSKKGKEMFCHTKPDNPYLKQDNKFIAVKNHRLTKIYMYFDCQVGSKATLRVFDEYGNSAECTSQTEIERANKPGEIVQKITENLKKLGDTVFYAENVEVNADSDAFIPISTVNNMRRTATAELEDKIINSYKKESSNENFKIQSDVYEASSFELAASVADEKQLVALKKAGCKKIYAPIELAEHFDGSEIAVLPRISKGDIEKLLLSIKNKEVLVRNIGQLETAKRCGKEIHIDFTMNVFNKYTADFYKQYPVKSITLSAELTLAQIKDIARTFPCEAIVYGKIPLMITENCMLKTSSGCTHGGTLTDRMGEKFLVKCLPDCKNEIYNSKPIVMSDKTDDLVNASLSFGRLSFTDESAKECEQIYNAYMHSKKLDTDFTRGKFYKGV